MYNSFHLTCYYVYNVSVKVFVIYRLSFVYQAYLLKIELLLKQTPSEPIILL